ncbi:hypothetical protein [Veillonella montpellierensis]|nr:hypothetical protein [Veillonella montpellierensis]
MKVTWIDIALIMLTAWSIYFIDFDKEAAKAFITGGVLVWLMFRRGILK